VTTPPPSMVGLPTTPGQRGLPHQLATARPPLLHGAAIGHPPDRDLVPAEVQELAVIRGRAEPAVLLVQPRYSSLWAPTTQFHQYTASPVTLFVLVVFGYLAAPLVVNLIRSVLSRACSAGGWRWRDDHLIGVGPTGLARLALLHAMPRSGRWFVLPITCRRQRAARRLQGSLGRRAAGAGRLSGMVARASGTGCRQKSGPVSVPDTPAITDAYSPHRGQAATPPSNEKKQPQKHATSTMVRAPVITGNDSRSGSHRGPFHPVQSRHLRPLMQPALRGSPGRHGADRRGTSSPESCVMASGSDGGLNG
jgi:hypothetical protein